MEKLRAFFVVVVLGFILALFGQYQVLANSKAENSKNIRSGLLEKANINSAATAPQPVLEQTPKSLLAIYKKVAAREKVDLFKLFSQIELKHYKTDTNGQAIFQVVKVAPGSIYDREGLKPGDLVWK